MITLVQHLQEIDDKMKKGGLNEETRICCLSKIGTIAIHSSMCKREEIEKACEYIDDLLLESDVVSEKDKTLIMFNEVLRSL